MCLLTIGNVQAASCYTTNVQKAEALFKQGRYADAKKRFAAAKACPDKPASNNLSARISACERKIKEQSFSSSSSSSSSRRNSSSSSSSHTQSGKVSITSISFANVDTDNNIIDSYGTSPLISSRVKYVKPKIYYTSTYNSTVTWQCYAKIYKPDGTLMSSSSSPSGYTYDFEWMVIPGSNTNYIIGWGNNSGGTYSISGNYRYEIWHNGSRLTTAYFTVKNDKSANIEKIWVDYDQYKNGKKGMLIHVKFTIDGMKGNDGMCALYFKYKNGDFLKDYNNSYNSSDGCVSCGATFTPGYDSTVYNDYQLFMPYEELHMSSGKSNLAFYAIIYNKSNNENLARSSDQCFDYTQP